MLFSRVLQQFKIGNCRNFTKLSTSQHVLRHHLELDYFKAKEYVERYKLYDRDADMVEKNIEFCKQLGFTNEEIVDNPQLLRTLPKTLEHQYLSLIEGGFDPVQPEALAKFLTYTNRKISVLKRLKFIKRDTNVYETFLKYIHPLPDDFSIELHGDQEIWKHLRYRILIKYLTITLETTNGKILEIFDNYRGIKLKSFQVICKNIKMARELGFTNERILCFPYILGATPKNLQDVLERCPTLIGQDIRDVIRLYPKLFCTTSESIFRVYDVLKRFNISDESIRKNLNIFFMAPETIESRLNELQRIPEFKVLKHNPWILKLILHQNRAKSRLEFLKKLHLKCNSNLTLLSDLKEGFDLYIREGRDRNSNYDMLMFLNGIFNIEKIETTMDFLEKLKKHPFWSQIPLTTIQDTFDYLVKEQKFKQSSVLEVIWILLYPRDHIKKAFKQIYRIYGNDRQITQSKKLNLALYFIEKEHNFTGNGIWLIKNELIHDETN